MHAWSSSAWAISFLDDADGLVDREEETTHVRAGRPDDTVVVLLHTLPDRKDRPDRPRDVAEPRAHEPRRRLPIKPAEDPLHERLGHPVGVADGRSGLVGRDADDQRHAALDRDARDVQRAGHVDVDALERLSLAEVDVLRGGRVHDDVGPRLDDRITDRLVAPHIDAERRAAAELLGERVLVLVARREEDPVVLAQCEREPPPEEARPTREKNRRFQQDLFLARTAAHACDRGTLASGQDRGNGGESLRNLLATSRPRCGRKRDLLPGCFGTGRHSPPRSRITSRRRCDARNREDPGKRAPTDELPPRRTPVADYTSLLD